MKDGEKTQYYWALAIDIEYIDVCFKISIHLMFHFCSRALHIRFKQQAALRG